MSRKFTTTLQFYKYIEKLYLIIICLLFLTGLMMFSYGYVEIVVPHTFGPLYAKMAIPGFLIMFFSAILALLGNYLSDQFEKIKESEGRI